jgi:enoyl-CoA hydratase/carnithine racemase
MSDVLLQERKEAVLLLTLNRPAVLNAVDRALRTSLIEACHAADADPEIRAIVITGAGRAFCSGQDLAEAVTYEARDVRAWLDHQRAMYQAVRDLSKPTIAAFNGIAAGAGLQIGLCCDMRVAHADASLGQPEVRAGLASVVGSYLIGLYCGYGYNVELSVGGALITGARAKEIGLVNVLAAPDAVVPTALDLARRLAEVSPVAMRLTKKRFREVTQPGFDAACEAGVRAQLEAYATGEPQRIMRGFLEARLRRHS